MWHSRPVYTPVVAGISVAFTSPAGISAEASGPASPDGTPLTPDSMLQAGSVSKAVTAYAAHRLAADVAQGSGASGGLASLPARARPLAAHALRSSFVTGLNEVFLIGAILTLVSAVLTFVLIRSRDFEVSAARSAAPAQPVTTGAGAGAR